MILFMCLMIPFTYFFILGTKSNDNSSISVKTCQVVGAIGLFISSVYCAVDSLFFSPVRYPVYNLVSEFLNGFIFEMILPVAVCALLFFLIFRDSISCRLKLFPFVLFGFYAVFIPYYSLTRFNTLSVFLLFAKPVLVSAMLVSVFFLFKKASSCVEEKNFGFLFLLFITFIIEIIGLPLIQTLWFLNYQFLYLVFAGSLYCALLLFSIFINTLSLKPNSSVE